MDDNAVGIAVGLIAALVIHGSLNSRSERAAERQMRETFKGSGTIRATVQEQAPFGIFANDIRSIDVYGNHMYADKLPLFIYRRSGWKGTIHHLRLHLTDCGIGGLQFSRLDADIPAVTYDLGRALYRNRLVIRGADKGHIRVSLSQSDVEAFVLRKYGKAFRDIAVVVTGDRLSLTGNAMVLSALLPFTVDGQVIARAGSFLDITDAVVTLNRKPVDNASAKDLLDRINPVLDVDKDLHLDHVIRVQHALSIDNQLVIEGEIEIPEATQMAPVQVQAPVDVDKKIDSHTLQIVNSLAR